MSGGPTFGNRQVEQLCDDRPDLKTILIPGSAIYEWVTDSFDGKYFGQRIFWHSPEPADKAMSSCLPPLGSYPAHILITSDIKITAFDRLGLLIFELHNIEHASEFAKVVTDARQGRIGREQFADELVRIELQTHESVVKFFELNPIPDAKGHHYKWLTSPTPSFEDYKASFNGNRRNTLYPESNFDVYKKAWDRLNKSVR